MKIEDQVCSLQQAKRLKELGIERDSLFNWCSIMPDPKGEMFYHGVEYRFGVEETLTELIAPAYTVAELGAMLPRKLRVSRKDYTFRINRYKTGTWEIKYRTLAYGGEMRPLRIESSTNEAEARAAMLIYLLENNHITADKINARLQSA